MELVDFNWNMLGTVGGSAVAVSVFVQILKHIVGNDKMDTWWLRALTFVVGVIVLFIGNVFTGSAITAEVLAMCFINGLVVYTSATGIYTTVAKG